MIGDANIRRNMTGLNMASRDTMKSAQVLPCDGLSSLDPALTQIRPESGICIVACITEMLLSGDDTGTVASCIESVCTVVKGLVVALCTSRPGLQVLVAPPLYRHRPFWYQRNLAQISGLFSCVFSNGVPRNLNLLPSFCSQDLMPDGIYLTPVSGLHYMMHLFDQAESVLTCLASSSDVQLGRVQEVCRQHDDRLVFLEQRHGRLDGRFDLKTAIDAEFSDFVMNRNEEDWFTLLGVVRINETDRRKWQQAVRRQVSEIIKLVLSVTKTRLDFSVLHVVNPIGRRTTGQTVLNVRLDSVSSSHRIREIYSGFFTKNAPVKLPSSLKGVSLRNKVTLNTRIRIRILRQMGLNYVEANGSGSSFKVKGYDSRPLLMTSPASGAGGDRPRTFNFIEAVRSLPGVFSDEKLMAIHQLVGAHHPGELQALFVVLRDDDRERIEHLIREKQRDRQRPQASVSFGVVSGVGSGMDTQSSALASLRLPPPPPPPSTPATAVVQPPSSTRTREESDSTREKRRRPSSSDGHDRDSKRSRDSKRNRSKKRRHRRSSSSSEDRHHGSKRSQGSRRGRGSRRRSSSSSSSSGSGSGSGSDSDSGSSSRER